MYESDNTIQSNNYQMGTYHVVVEIILFENRKSGNDNNDMYVNVHDPSPKFLYIVNSPVFMICGALHRVVYSL